MTIDSPVDSRARPRWFLPALLAVTLIALVLRIWTAVSTEVNVPIRNDARDYTSYAANLRLHGVYSADAHVLTGTLKRPPVPDARRPPGYALFLAPFFDLEDLGGFIHRVVVAQAWIGALVVWLAGMLGARLLGYRWALAVAAITALSPHLMVYVPYLLGETLFSLAFLVFVMISALALTAVTSPRRKVLMTLAGVALGLTCLIRPTLDQLAWVMVAVAMLLPSLRRRWPVVLMFLLGFLVVMAPWWMRNTQISGGVQSHAMAITIHQGSYPDMMRDGDPATFGYPYRGDPAAAAAESSVRAALVDLAGKFRAHPWQMAVWYLIGKPTALFAWREQSGWLDLFEYPVLHSPWLENPVLIGLTSVMKGLHPLLMVLGLLGTLLAFVPAVLRALPLSRGAIVGIRLAAFIHAYFLLVHLAALPLSRYSVPFRPLTYLLAMFALMCVFALVGRRRQRASEGKFAS